MRTIQEIFDELIAAKDANAELSIKLTSASATAIWKLLFYIIAVTIWVHEGLFYKHQEEVDAKINNAFAGTIPWYHRKCLEFQYGDTVNVFENGQVGYSEVDETKQIIKHAAIVETGNFLSVKVAKENMAMLSPAEEDAFKSYIKKIKFAGTKLSIVNVIEDYLFIEMKIYYDPQVLTNNGTLLSEPSTYPIQNAILQYINNIVFGGTVVKSKIVDACQAASGVCDAELLSIQASSVQQPSFQPITSNSFTAYSGKFIINTLLLTFEPCNII